MSLLSYTPSLDLAAAKRIASVHFGVKASSITELPSERDQNFKVITCDGRSFVLKIANGREDAELLQAQHQMIRRLRDSAVAVPQITIALNGNEFVCVDNNGQTHIARLVSYTNGIPLASMKYRSKAMINELGHAVGNLRIALNDFDHQAFHRKFHWDLAQASDVIKEKLHLVTDDTELRGWIAYFVDLFERHSAPLLNDIPKSVIHNDLNDANIIVRHHSVAGIIDFGDAVYSWSIGELAVAIAYAVLEQDDPLSLAAELVAGCHQQFPLSEPEVDVLYGLVCMRLCVSAILAADQQWLRPDDPYLSISQKPIRALLPKLESIPYKIATTTFRQACGWHSQYGGTNKWIRNHSREFAFPVVTGKENPAFCLLDCSVASTLLPPDLDSTPISQLTSLVFGEMSNQQADIGIGRYLEPRIIYAAAHFGTSELSRQRRTIHLGVDLFAPSGTTIIAPLPGIVECAIKIRLPLDYGNLLILKHEPAEGIMFYTLYGHLADKTLEEIATGQKVDRGQTLGWLGLESENGGWPPHLHFQIMHDLLDYDQDFPGVCLASQIETWSEICPDPNMILGLSDDFKIRFEPEIDKALSARNQHVGPSLSVAYECPLKAVRGWQHWLFDHTGRRFLDAYNNVPHVGHCHPDVVEALTDQARLLNTNTRYLNDSLNEFSSRLAATMPDPLEVCFFVNSASEANELAIRLARTATGHVDLIVLEAAYHGHTTTLIDISPYKHSGCGGNGAPGWVHVAPLADVYRGKFKDPATAGQHYAREIATTINQLKKSGKGLCGFIAESCPSVAGQIMFPNGYLAGVYQAVRDAGGICIADEVQTGYGRLGSALYGFQLQQVVPDIVVLGKPIGNGHPLAAVVTTRQIAESFDNGMEFFSTFGGNNVSCRVGLAVLEVMDRESLQSKSLQTGQFLLSQFAQLKSRHDLIGDVRGSGLFLGIELVRNHQTLTPAAQEASFIVNRMRDKGILIGTDGPLNNVIKIRPPMSFGQAEAEILVKTLDQCFELVAT